jgi:hypothetical protein
MDHAARRKFLQSPWEPKIYSAPQLAELFKISERAALRIILNINGLTVAQFPWVTHHDLVQYLRDTLAVSEVPDHAEELPPQGLWLIENGWSLDPSRTVFRWVSPDDRGGRYALKTALALELYAQQTNHEESQTDIIDVEYEVRSS